MAARNFTGLRFFPGGLAEKVKAGEPSVISGVTADQDPDAQFLVAVVSGEQINPIITVIGVTENGS